MLLYAVTIFLSAFLLFQVQPIIAKILLPWFGGSAAVWTTCLLFFQVVLLLGYLYAHESIRYLPPKVQSLLHVALLALSVLFLRVIPKESWKPQGTEEPTLRLLILLAVTIGLPYFLLSTTGPLLQAWYAARGSADGGAKPFPYRLYSLSNLGSLLALVSYPVVVEPRFTLHQQSLVWSLGYGGFVLCCGILALQSRRASWAHGQGEGTPSSEGVGTPPSGRLHLFWLTLSACSCTLLLAISNHITQNIAPVPFLWVLPLTLYLLSFILCFAEKGGQWTKLFLPLAAPVIGAMTYALSVYNMDVKLLIPLFTGGLFVCCMICHGELARSKPHPRYLTSFYLMISLGGAMGGIFVGLLAPHLFRGDYELHFGMALCAVLTLNIIYRTLSLPRGDSTGLILTGLTMAAILFLAIQMHQSISAHRLMIRNFYGVLKVREPSVPDSYRTMRILYNGTILHGTQFLHPIRRTTPTTYYGPNSGAGLAIRVSRAHSPIRVGLIGLGVGTLASFGRHGDIYRFYEINPLVVQLARQEFTFLRDTKSKVEVVLGDARLSLEREPKQNFDVIVVDAFSGDSIPVHLLTREAFALYFRHLKASGVLAVHISNRYLDLKPVVGRAAEALGKEAVVVNSKDDIKDYIFSAEWVLVTGHRRFLENPLIKKAGKRFNVPKGFRIWTDDYSSLYRILK